MLPNKKNFLQNFNFYENWEKKYLYIIDLGKKLKYMPISMKTKKNLIYGCHSKTWINIIQNKNNKLYMYGDSNAVIVKGLIAIIFIFYKKQKLNQLNNKDIFLFIKKLKFNKNLTYFRLHGLQSIIYSIQDKIRNIKYQTK